MMLTYPGVPAEGADMKATKTGAIKSARLGLVGIEALIEQAINENPPRFTPAEAKDIRARFEMLVQKVEDVLHLLAQERDDFEQLGLQVRKLTADLDTAKKSLHETTEKQTYWYTEATRRRKIMEREGLEDEKE